MQRHPFDPVSAALGILAIAAGLLVALGEAVDCQTDGRWWLAGRRRAGRPGDHPLASPAAADGDPGEPPVDGDVMPARLVPTWTAGPLLRLDRLTKRYPGVHRARRPHGGRATRADRPRRCQRRRQDDDVPPAARPGPPDRGQRRGVRHRRRRRPDRRAHPPRVHARARLPAARPERRRRRRHVRRAERAPGPGRSAAGVGHPRPRRPRRGPVPPDRRVLDRHAPAHEARPGARRRPGARAARRADGRARPARPGGDAGPRRPARHVRDLGADGDPPARRRAAGVRPRADDRRRPARRVRRHRLAARAHRPGDRRRRRRRRACSSAALAGCADRRPSSRGSSRSRSTATTTSTRCATSSPTSACRCTA